MWYENGLILAIIVALIAIAVIGGVVGRITKWRW